MKIYIAGKITGLPNYMELFQSKQTELESQGYTVVNPSKLDGILGQDFTHAEYMHICYSLIDICDAVYLLENWMDSKGACMELDYSIEKGKTVVVE